MMAVVSMTLSCTDKNEDSAAGETDADWAMGGTAYGMAMNADVAVDVDACSFEFSDWNMGMSVPEGGTMNGTDIQLTGSDFWSTCTGVAKSPTEAEGLCGGGESWAMELLE
jgi:hypothetical protein